MEPQEPVDSEAHHREDGLALTISEVIVEGVPDHLIEAARHEIRFAWMLLAGYYSHECHEVLATFRLHITPDFNHEVQAIIDAQNPVGDRMPYEAQRSTHRAM